MKIQPPARLATSVPAHSRSSIRNRAWRAITVVTGTRKFSVNSSLRARVRAMKPTEKASPASSLLWVASSTSSRASTPVPTSMPPTRPVASRGSVGRHIRRRPSSTERRKASSTSCSATAALVSDASSVAGRRHCGHVPAVAAGKSPALPACARWRVASVLVRCPGCAHLDDRVIDSRQADDGAAIRRRRECLACGRRFTTFERLEEAPLIVRKRSGSGQPFSRSKLVAGMKAAAKNRPVSDEQLEAVAAEIEDQARLRGPEVTSAEVGRMVLERLRRLDEVAYLRFASVYKVFEEPGDFQRELGLLTEADPAPPEA